VTPPEDAGVTGAPNLNTLWARALADEFARHGLHHVCVGSGSRSAPLVEAVARDPRLTVHPHVDERSASYFALGIAASTGRPAAVVTTSGTATANLFPAVIEASQSDIPLLVLTADRPARLRGLDANQTIDQAGLYGGYPRLAIDLPLPRPGDVRQARVAVARVWAAATGALSAPGPAHLNIQLEKPLEPTPVPGDLPDDLSATEPRTDGRPFTTVAAADVAAASGVLARRLAGARRPLIVCGPGRPEVGAAALALAAATGAPLLADPLSGARFAPGAAGSTISWVDAILAGEAARRALRPDLVVRVGASPTSAAVNGALAGWQRADHVVVDRGIRWKDHLALADEYIVAEPAAALARAAQSLEARAGSGVLPVEPSWAAAWRTASDAAGAALEPALRDTWFEGAAAAAVVRALRPGSTLFVGSSMPIRDVDAFAAASDVDVRAIGFRGASGIDGSVSGALGACAGAGRPTVALLGDLTLLHDVGALLLAGDVPAPFTLVVIQNRGGGIFHMLPIADFDPPFTRHVVMPHQVDFAAVAEAARIPHRLTPSIGSLEEALASGHEAPGIRMLEVPVDREENWTRRRAAIDAAGRAATEALETA